MFYISEKKIIVNAIQSMFTFVQFSIFSKHEPEFDITKFFIRAWTNTFEETSPHINSEKLLPQLYKIYCAAEITSWNCLFLNNLGPYFFLLERSGQIYGRSEEVLWPLKYQNSKSNLGFPIMEMEWVNCEGFT